MTDSPRRPFLDFEPMLRALGIASDGRKLVIALIGLIATSFGWSLIDRIGGKPGASDFMMGSPITFDRLASLELERAGVLISVPFRLLVMPFVSLFSRSATNGGPVPWLHLAVLTAWSVVVWGVAGGAIARIAVVQASTGRRVGILTALKFAAARFVPLVGAPLTPMVGVAFFAALGAAFGLMTRVPFGIGQVIATVLGFVPVALGLVMALILAGLALGWPLMHATVAAEGEDLADALSRAYSYVNQRIVRYVAHLGIAWGLGTLGLFAVSFFARMVLGLADWGVSLGSGNGIESFWVTLVGLVVQAWIFSYFWSAESVIYLILRRDVDGTEWHDVYLPEHDADPFAPEPVPEPSKTVEPEVA